MIEHNLSRVWDQLRGQKVQRTHFLEDVRIRGLRGIGDLRVPFVYPVTVLCGPNACGKSTVLQALACAYRVEDARLREYVPSSIFPRFQSGRNDVPRDDESTTASLDYGYLDNAERVTMRWTRAQRRWNKSFGGRKGGQQPTRRLFMRTLANLSNPSEVRSYLQLGRLDLTMEDVDAALLAFAHRILPFRYHELKVISHPSKELLFVRRSAPGAGPEAPGSGYSEFHMSAGERSVLRLSRALSQLENALVLIDEIETGLHPYTQQQLVYELQLLALRNQLQIVVATHSPIIIDSVPEEARVFLERDRATDNVTLKPPYRDVIQKAMYGVSRNKLSFLCEDDVAEAMILGVFDHLNVKLQLLPSDIVIGRDTSKTEYPAHLKALATFDLLSGFVFVLDGDGRDYELRLRERAKELGQLAPRIVCLPGDGPPEAWLWARLGQHASEYAQAFGVDETFLSAELRRLQDLFEPAADRPTVKQKQRFHTLCTQSLNRETRTVARVVGWVEARRGDLYEVTQAIEMAVRDWRSQKA